MKPEAQKILTMIEATTPESPVEVLDEIDARVECLVQKKKFVAWPHVVQWKEGPKSYRRMATVDDPGCAKVVAQLYTRSIDAQEAFLRRDGWDWILNRHYGTPYMVMEKGDPDQKKTLQVRTPALASEPLARLHAWVQVWGMEE